MAPQILRQISKITLFKKQNILQYIYKIQKWTLTILNVVRRLIVTVVREPRPLGFQRFRLQFRLKQKPLVSIRNVHYSKTAEAAAPRIVKTRLISLCVFPHGRCVCPQ